MARGLRDLDVPELRGKRALVRVDYNVPLDDRGEVADETRIRASLPTLRYLLERGARPVLLSHLGRPGGEPDPSLSLAPLALELERLLGETVRLVGPPDTDDAVEASRELPAGSVLLAENVRFLPGETSNDPDLARRMARLGDLFVNDAFGACHRAHASTAGVPRFLRPAVAGLLVERELEALDAVREAPDRPLVVLFGGAKIGDKIPLLEDFLDRAERVLVGGAMANTFLEAAGEETGESLVEEDVLEEAARLLERGGETLSLPTDLVVAPGPDAGEAARTVASDEIPPAEMALDIGPATREAYAGTVAEARTVFWNGPMGYFERKPFDEGTVALARAVARASLGGAFTVVGGGDSASAVRRAGVADRISHVSTGGGAALEYLARGTLPALEALEPA